MSHDPDEIDNYKLTAELVTPPVVGSLVVYPNGSFDFTPPTGFMGTTTFTYQVCDAVAASAPALASTAVT